MGKGRIDRRGSKCFFWGGALDQLRSGDQGGVGLGKVRVRRGGEEGLEARGGAEPLLVRRDSVQKYLKGPYLMSADIFFCTEDAAVFGRPRGLGVALTPRASRLSRASFGSDETPNLGGFGSGGTIAPGTSLLSAPRSQTKSCQRRPTAPPKGNTMSYEGSGATFRPIQQMRNQ